MTDKFTFVSAFLSIVVALALTHLLTGIAAMLRARVARASWRHAAWLGIFVFGCVDYWFSLWGLRAETDWSLAYVLYLLLLATVLYVGCHLVVPPVREGEAIDIAAFEELHRRKYLAAFGVYVAIAIVANLNTSGFASAVWLNLLMLALVTCAWAWRDVRVQSGVTAAIVALCTYYAVTYIPAL